MNTITIANRSIGKGESCFIIAEAGSNHDGSLKQAKRLCDIAAEAGADAVKFQIFKAEELSADRTMQKWLRRLEFKRDWIGTLRDYAEKRGIMFLATPYDTEAVDLLNNADVPAFKIASGDLTNLPLIEYIAEKGKPIILSTGLGSLAEIREALDTIYGTGNRNIALLHCVVSYPAEPKDADLKVMLTLKRIFSVPAGFSDHTREVSVPIGAAALGADIIEKHFTISRELPGPDHGYALEPEELKGMVKGIRDVEKALGNGVNYIGELEKKNFAEARRSIYAKVDIAKGTIITRNMLAILRPAVGVAPKYMEQIIGKKAKRNFKAYEAITWEI